MSIDNKPFTKTDIENYLKELGKELKKRGRGIPMEIILVGGASILVNYDFRVSSYDIDAYYAKASIMKECINAVGDKFGLPTGWVNDDFMKTSSFTPKIIEYSKYYKKYSGVLTVRTVKAEYLVAMKLVSGRKYKKDLSDVAGIIYEQQLAGAPLTYEMIDRAVIELYGDWTRISKDSKDMLKKILSCDNMQELFDELSQYESDAKDILANISNKYPDVVNRDNVDDVIAAAMKKK